jgi:hypothetical protein
MNAMKFSRLQSGPMALSEVSCRKQGSSSRSAIKPLPKPILAKRRGKLRSRSMNSSVKSSVPAPFQGQPRIFSLEHRLLSNRNTPSSPFSPPADPAQWLFQGRPAKSKFLAAPLKATASEKHQRNVVPNTSFIRAKKLKPLIFAIIALGAQVLTCFSAIPPEIQVRCGVVFCFHAKANHQAWSINVPNAFNESGWGYMLHLGYAPFVTITNASNTTIVLDSTSIAFLQPELSMRFQRIGSLSGNITTQFVPLSSMFTTGYQRRTAYQLSGTFESPGIIAPGQSKILTPNINSNSTYSSVHNYTNSLTSFTVVSGWRGPAFAYYSDFLTGSMSNVTPGINGDKNLIGVIATKLSNAWDVEVSPTNGTLSPECKLYLWQGDKSWADWFEPASRIKTFPFRLGASKGQISATSMANELNTPIGQWRVTPILIAEIPPTSFSANTVVPSSADADGDGMDDAWEVQNFQFGHDEPDHDLDMDGFSNQFEFLAGTNPKDPADFVRQSVARVGNQVVLTWSSVPGRSYIIEASGSLSAWSPIHTVIGAAAPAKETSKVMHSSAMNRFFRIKIVSPWP